ncbi:glycosyltransferase [Clostridium perfringens]|nr:glycosyltransferase [Clostridium perfringens]
MKILFIPWTFSNGGGSEKILLNLMTSLKKLNFDISLLEVEKGHHNFNTNSNIFKYLGFIFKNPILENSIFYKIKRKLLILLLENFTSIIKNLYIKEDFDIVISFNYLYPSFLASTFKENKIMWFHGSIENLDYSNLNGREKMKIKSLYKKQKRALQKADYVVAISNETELSIRHLYPEVSDKLVKISNGYDFSIITEQSNAFSVDPIDIIAIGRLDENKNFKMLIDSAKELIKKIPNLKIKILGEGNQYELLNTLIVENSLENNIELLGYISNPYPYLKASSILVLTSKSEGFPTVIVEAMALDCPFVSTNVGGVNELSNNQQCGKVISNPNELTNTLESILTNESYLSEMKANCKDYIYKYSLDNQAKEVNSLISSLFKN